MYLTLKRYPRAPEHLLASPPWHWLPDCTRHVGLLTAPSACSGLRAFALAVPSAWADLSLFIHRAPLPFSDLLYKQPHPTPLTLLFTLSPRRLSNLHCASSPILLAPTAHQLLLKQTRRVCSCLLHLLLLLPGELFLQVS